ncbi:Actin-like 6A [Ascosphaera acerosa]|nr:Actin-like 6A [Ascosphaera acerosa]
MATTYAAQQPLQLQQQQQPPPPVDYGQDDIAAVILDPGYSVTRAGLGGDDAPRSVIPTAYGRYSAGGGGDGGGDGDGDGDGETRFVYGDELYVKPRPGLSIHNPMNRDGTVEDWDMARRVWEHAFTSRLTGTSAPRHLFNDAATSLATTTAKTTPAAATAAATPTLDDRPLSETPLLMTECGWNSAKAREKMIETAMDEWGAPAFYLARSGSLAAFAAGRASALVVDVGAANVAVTPVHDGTAIKRAITHGPLAGEFVSAQIRAVFRLNAPRAISLAPHYLVAAKQGQSGRASPEYRAFTSPSRAPHASYRRFMEERTVLQFKESVVQAWPGPTGLLTLGPNGVPMEELARSSAPARPFEFPDGHSQAFGTERFRVVASGFSLVGAAGGFDLSPEI